jgi:hypothetical protein
LGLIVHLIIKPRLYFFVKKTSDLNNKFLTKANYPVIIKRVC